MNTEISIPKKVNKLDMSTKAIVYDVLADKAKLDGKEHEYMHFSMLKNMIKLNMTMMTKF